VAGVLDLHPKVPVQIVRDLEAATDEDDRVTGSAIVHSRLTARWGPNKGASDGTIKEGRRMARGRDEQRTE
jgi:hypothetical protein